MTDSLSSSSNGGSSSIVATLGGDKPFVNVSYEVKNQIKMFVGERSKTTFDSGCKMFDVIFKDQQHSDFEVITFQNNYTGYLSIKAKEREKNAAAASDWTFLLKRHKLMPNVHGETMANENFILRKQSMLQPNMKNIGQLRFILQQPSCIWRDFGLDDLKFQISNPNYNLDRLIESYSSKCDKIKKANFEKLPPLDDVSSRLQKLWSLCYEVNKLNKNELEDNPRYDIDGYDVNMILANN